MCSYDQYGTPAKRRCTSKKECFQFRISLTFACPKRDDDSFFDSSETNSVEDSQRVDEDNSGVKKLKDDTLVEGLSNRSGIKVNLASVNCRINNFINSARFNWVIYTIVKVVLCGCGCGNEVVSTKPHFCNDPEHDKATSHFLFSGFCKKGENWSGPCKACLRRKVAYFFNVFTLF